MQIRRMGEGKLAPLAKLYRRSEKLRGLVERGGVVGKGERYPEEAIAVPSGEQTVREEMEEIVKDDLKKSKSRKRAREEEHLQGDGSKAKAGKEKEWRRVRQAVSSLAKGHETADGKKQKKEMIVKLSVDWDRLYIKSSGRMVVLADREVTVSP